MHRSEPIHKIDDAPFYIDTFLTALGNIIVKCAEVKKICGEISTTKLDAARILVTLKIPSPLEFAVFAICTPRSPFIQISLLSCQSLVIGDA